MFWNQILILTWKYRISEMIEPKVDKRENLEMHLEINSDNQEWS